MEDDSQSPGSRTLITLRMNEKVQTCVDLGIYATLPDNLHTSERTDELCEVCSKIHLGKFFECTCFRCRPHHYHLGKLEDIQSRNSCPLCRMLSTVFSSAKAYLPEASQGNPLLCKLVCTKDNDSIGIHFEQSTPQWDTKNTEAIHVIRQCIEDSMISGDKVSNLNPGSEKATPDRLFGRLMESRQVDYDLIRKWIQLCETTHGDICSRFSLKSSRPSKIRLIDVFNRQIVEATTNERYLALSYVWGAGSPHCLNSQNLQGLQEPHGLTDDQMPKTIQDALNLVSRIGEQYLWVDRFCILMDDDHDKTLQMSIMDQVYSSATLTIISADASCSDDCIPGVEPHTRRSFQQSEMIHGVRYVTTQSELTSTILRMNWSTRGWTYQEAFLSSRCLVFTPYQASFQCKSEVWCEDSYWVGTGQTKNEPLIGNALCCLPNGFDVILPVKMKPGIVQVKVEQPCDFRQYINAVEAFSRRHLTRQADVLWAFTGVTKAFQPIFSNGFAWGLPVEKLGAALLWQPLEYVRGPRNGSHTERKGMHASIIQSNMIKLPFPSWSWTSWGGGVQYHGKCEWIVEEFVEWHQPTYYIVNTTKPFNERWHEASSHESSKAGPNHEHELLLPPYAIMSERALGFLRFTAASVQLDVELSNITRNSSKALSLKFVACGCYRIQYVPCIIRTSTEKIVGSIWIARSWLGELSRKTGEFILLSERTEDPETETYPQLQEPESDSKSEDPEFHTMSGTKHIEDCENQRKCNVMLIDWKEGPHCAVATRVGLTQVNKNDWTELKSSSKEIVLS